jgi:predicted site-specific integrase-resolvase
MHILYTYMLSETMSVPTVRRAYSIKEAAEMCGRSYYTVYRAVCRGDIRVLSGFGRAMISDEELNRFLGKSEIYRGKRTRVAKQKAAA